MDLPVHDQILWHACVLANRRLGGDKIGDPRLAYPFLVRGSWMNDTNQVSPLLDMNSAVDVTVQQRTLFHGLWKLELEGQFERAPHLAEGDVLVAAAPQIMKKEPDNTDGFGQYIRFDHLDILHDEPAAEYDAAWSKAERGGRAMSVHHTVTSHIFTRLVSSTVAHQADARLDPALLTFLGRGLHTIADFFSHTNYVELLLWSLAWRGELDAALLDAFNQVDPGAPEGRPLLRCPLPRPGQDRSHLLGDTVIWYGPEPAATPLVSSLFDLKDTTFSLLHIYAAHLLRTDGVAQSDGMLDLAMAVFDVQGAKLIKGAWKLLQAMDAAFAAVGRAARNTLANGITSVAQSKQGVARDLLEEAATLVRRYDSKEAADWARAGKLGYVARELQLAFAQQLSAQRPDQPKLPHHSLLAKDHVTDDVGGILRHKVACLLATEVSAAVLAWHFAPPSPARDRYLELAARTMIHPWRLIDGGGFDGPTLASRVRAADGTARWQRLALDGLQILGVG